MALSAKQRREIKEKVREGFSVRSSIRKEKQIKQNELTKKWKDNLKAQTETLLAKLKEIPRPGPSNETR